MRWNQKIGGQETAYSRIGKVLIALALIFFSEASLATSCSLTERAVARSNVVFTAIAHRISLEPQGVKTPKIAKINLNIGDAAFQGVNPGEEVTVSGRNGSIGYTWTGTKEDLPALKTLSWVEIEVRVKDVWRGSVQANEVIYAAGTQWPLLGEPFLMGFPADRVNPLSFLGPCQPLVQGEELNELLLHMEAPLYSYE